MLPDITMCADKECPLSKQCYRFTAEPNEFRQSYFSVSPRDESGCSYFWKNENETPILPPL